MVPTWRRPEELRRCLGALAAQQRLPAEVLVVKRPDDEETRAVAENAPLAVRSVTVETPGVVAALEAGRHAAKGQVLALTDDDSVPQPDWLAHIAEHFESNERLGAVGGRDRLAGNTDSRLPSTQVGRIEWYGRRVGEHHRGEGPALPADVLKGVNMAVRTKALERIGFDKHLRGSGAQRHWELALCLALKRSGWQIVYDPAVVVDHNEGARFGSSQRGFPDSNELRDAAHNEMYALVKWLPAWRKPLALLYGLLVGSREMPGLLTALERGVRDGGWSEVLRRFATATRGRLLAIGTALGA